ncbi:MAG: hypothetical protein ACXVIP_00220 [Halobacteriota archaeon]
MTSQLIILDPHDRTLYVDVMLKLRRIDTELSKLQTGLRTKHRMHADSVLRFVFLDLHQIEARSRDIRDRQLRVELRKEVLKRKELYYEAYDALCDTFYLH